MGISVGSSSGGRKKDLNFEVNITSLVDALSILVIYLLMTYQTTIQMGSMNAKQAIGGTAYSEGAKPAIVWTDIAADGSIAMRFQDAPGVPSHMANVTIKGVNGLPDYTALERIMGQMKQTVPLWRTAMIKPQAETSYNSIIGVMDRMRALQVVDLGVVPL